MLRFDEATVTQVVVLNVVDLAVQQVGVEGPKMTTHLAQPSLLSFKRPRVKHVCDDVARTALVLFVQEDETAAKCHNGLCDESRACAACSWSLSLVPT